MSERNAKILRKFLRETPTLSEGDQKAMRRSLSCPLRSRVRKTIVDHLISAGKLDRIGNKSRTTVRWHSLTRHDRKIITKFKNMLKNGNGVHY